MDDTVFDPGLVFLVDEEEDTPAAAVPASVSRQQHHHQNHHQLRPNSAPANNNNNNNNNTTTTASAAAVSDAAFLDPSLYYNPDPFSIAAHQGPAGGVCGLGLLGSGPDPIGPDLLPGAAEQQLVSYPFHDAVAFSSHPESSGVWTPPPARSSIDEFFAKTRAYRPPVPCNYCRRLRLQCLILQTTAANPNPVTSCSSCVALFRDCSLAERGKRQASAFETLLPVINHLHGVCEEGTAHEGDGAVAIDGQLAPPPAAACSSAPLLYKRNSTRSVKKTRVLKNWFASHLDHPYPAEEEKTLLSEQSGLSKTQVINWFANARRRHRLATQSNLNNGSRIFLQGSPVPPPFLMGMSPIDRWKHSPPEDEPVSTSVIEKAIFNQPNASAFPQVFDSYPADAPPSSTSGDSRLYNPSMFQDASSNSGSSAFSMYHSDDAGLFSPSTQSSAHADQDPGPGSSTSTTKRRPKGPAFQCTFCLQGFKKKYDWVRHERSIHLPGVDSWICTVPLPEDQSNLVWRINHEEPECIFCGQSSPTEQHMQSHEFQACAERPVSERTFTRKDHLWQHLHKFHRCRKWEGWKPDLHVLQRRQERFESQCGFCQLEMRSWEERVQHLASHFRRGVTMAEWTGSSGSGVRDGRNDGGAMTRMKGPQSGEEAGPLSLFSDVASGGNWP